MEFNQLKELIELFSQSEVGKLEINQEGLNLKLSKPRERVVTTGIVESTAMTAIPAQAPAPLPAAAPAKEEAPAENPNYTYVTSPIVGTFYRAPNPQAKAFVEVGDVVSVGQTLCIVEAMKLMNEIHAESRGVVAEILVEDTDGVQFGQNLIALKPA